MRIAIYPGSFDPITLGHLDIIERSSKLFDKVIVVIMDNSKKQGLFSKEERLTMIKEACSHMTNVECEIGSGLSVEYAKNKGACAMIRGMRAVADYEYEMKLSMTNMKLNKDIETIFLLSKPEHAFISSSMIKELVSYKQDVSGFVPRCVEMQLKQKF